MSVMYIFCWCSFKKLFSVEIIVSQGLVSSDKSLQDTIVSLALVLMCAEFIRLSPKWVYEVLSTQWGANAGLFFFLCVFFVICIRWDSLVARRVIAGGHYSVLLLNFLDLSWLLQYSGKASFPFFLFFRAPDFAETINNG